MEEWRDIRGFEGYQVSNLGRVRSFWVKKHYSTGYGTYRELSNTPCILSQSDDGNGYMKVMLYCKQDGRRYCKKVHRLVAETFIPKNCDEIDGDYTVDHIRSGREGKLDNSTGNLRWISRAENIRKAYRDGVCDDRIRASLKPVIVTDLWTGEEKYFQSIKEAAFELRLDRTSISHALARHQERVGHYIFEYAGREERLLYGTNDQCFSWV